MKKSSYAFLYISVWRVDQQAMIPPQEILTQIPGMKLSLSPSPSSSSSSLFSTAGSGVVGSKISSCKNNHFSHLRNPPSHQQPSSTVWSKSFSSLQQSLYFQHLRFTSLRSTLGPSTPSLTTKFTCGWISCNLVALSDQSFDYRIRSSEFTSLLLRFPNSALTVYLP